jgi:hypothetical protein
MRGIDISTASVPSVFSHSHRVTGVLAGRPELDALTRTLETLGVSVVEVLEGTPGAGYLDQREHSFQALLELFLGDLETETRHHYAQEVEKGRLVFAVPVTEGNKDEVVDAVLAHGAGHVVHFGRWVSERYP